jgi:hypothetical protein
LSDDAYHVADDEKHCGDYALRFRQAQHLVKPTDVKERLEAEKGQKPSRSLRQRGV